MKNFVTLSFYLLLLGNVVAQNIQTITVSGNIFDSVRNIPITNAEIDFTMSSDEYDIHLIFSTDSSGNYQASLRAYKGVSLFHLIVKYGPNVEHREYWSSEITSNAEIVHDIQITPASLCWDSFLPAPYSFTKNESTLSIELHANLKKEFKRIQTELNNEFETNYLQINAYSSYGESKKVAMKRMNAVYKLALESGIAKENIQLNLVADKEMFICEYCDGCHYFFLKGKGYTLSKEQFAAEKDILKRQEQDALRQVVILTWERK